MDRFKKITRIFLGVPLTIISFIFLGKVFFDNKSTILSAFSKIDISLFLLSILLYALFFTLKSIIWILILKNRDHFPPIRQTIYNYSLSELKRYIPGSIFSIFGRMDSHKNLISQKETLKGFGIEALLLLLSALFVSLPAIFYIFPKFILSVLLLLTIIACIFHLKYKKLFYKYLDCFSLFVISWIIYGIACLFVTLSFTNVAPSVFLLILSFFVLAWVIGYLSFVTPMGIGVREVVITSLLSFFIPLSIALSIAALSRIAMSIGELLNISFIYSFKNLNKNSKILQINPYLTIVAICGILYFSLLTTLSIQKHNSFLSGRFDLGNMSQTVWNTSHGRFFTLTNPDGIENISRFAIHSDIILILFAPIYLLWESPIVLLIFQSFFLAIGGIFVFLIGKSIIGNEKLAAVLSISYYLNFWLHEQNLFDFHAVTLATPFLLAAFYFMHKKRYILFSITLLLATLTKENIFLIASIFGIYLFFMEKKKIIGLLLTLIPLIIFYYLSSVLIPQARGEAHFVIENYSYLGDSLPNVLINLLSKPNLLINQLLNYSTLLYFFYHFVPLGFLSLLSPFLLLFTTSEMAIYLLSGNFEYRSYQYHFGAAIIPFIYISAIYSIHYLFLRFKNKNIEKFIIYYVLLNAIVSMYLFSPFPGMRNADTTIFEKNNSITISKYLSLIPKNSSVAATNNLGAHLSHRERIYVVPFGLDIADYLVFYKEKLEISKNINTLKYDLLIKTEDFLLYRKKSVSPCSNCNM